MQLDVRDVGSIPRPGRSPGGWHGNPLQYSCLENSMDRGAWWAIVHRVAQSQTHRSNLAHTHACTSYIITFFSVKYILHIWRYMHTHVCLYAHYMFVYHVCAHMCSMCTCVCCGFPHVSCICEHTRLCVCWACVYTCACCHMCMSLDTCMYRYTCVYTHIHTKVK